MLRNKENSSSGVNLLQRLTQKGTVRKIFMTSQPTEPTDNEDEGENVNEAVLRRYLHKIEKDYQTGYSTEHTYRSSLKELLESLFPGVIATNEPKRIKCGAPDFILTKKQTPLGYIETKDIRGCTRSQAACVSLYLTNCFSSCFPTPVSLRRGMVT